MFTIRQRPTVVADILTYREADSVLERRIGRNDNIAKSLCEEFAKRATDLANEMDEEDARDG